MKIGILGGSFNPVHNGHLAVAKSAAGKIVDEVWLMPCKNHPLDKKLEYESSRADMIKLAIQGLTRVKLSDFELKKIGTSYTFQTLRGLRGEYPKHDFYWIIGSDLLRQLPEWHGFDILQEEARFIVFHRQRYPIINPSVSLEASIYLNQPDISSTQIRDRVRRGKSISDLVPKSVEEYIAERKLYL